MSAQEKTRPTKKKRTKLARNSKSTIEVNGKSITPGSFAKLLSKAIKLEPYKKKLIHIVSELEQDEEPSLSVEDFFADIGVEPNVIRGSRIKENLSQTELAIRLNKITGMKRDQGKISKLETGDLNVSKRVAEGLAEIFDTDYRVFL